MNDDRPLAARRSYHSPTRLSRKAATGQRILDALVASLAAGSFDSLSMDEIAAAAGVSPATLYRHFPSRESLFDGLTEDYFNHRLGDIRSLPTTPDEIATDIRCGFAAFDQDPAFVRAFFLTNLGRAARARGRQRRIAAIQAALQPLTATLDEAERTRAEAVIAYLVGIPAWLTMTEEFGLTGAQVGQAVSWAITTLLADLRARQAASGSTRPASDDDRSEQPTRGERDVNDD